MRRLFDGRSQFQFPPPMWKVRRELNRVGLQIDDFALRIFGISLTGLYLRIFINPKVKCANGALTIDDRVAIYMIFPSDGLLVSHVIALDYIIQCGYVPVVVSNLPLDAKAQKVIQTKSAFLVMRPNFGYDFAAYRDALKALGGVTDRLKYLAILNDSVWFPLHPQNNWFAEAEATGYDFVGSVFHCAMDPDFAWDFSKDAWHTDSDYPHFHYGSYSLLISGDVVRSPQFVQFWRDYRATNDKTKTIIGGEIGLSRTVISAGFSHGATLDTSGLDTLLHALPLDRLHELAENMIVPMYPALRQLRVAVLSTSPINRLDLHDFILKCVVKQGPGYALADFDIRERSGVFLKKSPVALDQSSADLTLHLLDQLPGPEAKVFSREARQIYAKKHITDSDTFELPAPASNAMP